MAAGEAYRIVMHAVTETDQDAAVRLLHDALRHDPECKLARYHLGVIYAGRGLHGKAIAEFRRIVDELDPEDPGVWFLLARQYDLSGQDDEAFAAYEETLARDGACEKAYLYSARLLLAADENSSGALKRAETALMMRRPGCMVPLEEFEDTLRAARRAVPPLGRDASDPLERLADIEVGRLVALGPHVEELLADHGISCASCSGYERETLRAAAQEAGIDLRPLESDLRSRIEEGARGAGHS
jgi:tetratricopeptide (TPR) repeat protein